MNACCTIVFIVPCDGQQTNSTNTLLIIIILYNPLFSKGISPHHATWSPSQKTSRNPTSSPLQSPLPSNDPSQFPTFEPSNHATFEPTVQETNTISFANLSYQPSQAPTHESTDTQIPTSASSYTPTNSDELMLSMSHTFLTITLGSIIILFY